MASHHTICVTDDVPALTGFLQTVMGLGVAAEFDTAGPDTTPVLGWPAGSPDTSGRLLGKGTTGLVEVIGIPEPLRDIVPPGIAMITFAVADLEAKVEQCRAAGVEVSDIIRIDYGGVDVSVAIATVAGIRFELVRFDDQ